MKGRFFRRLFVDIRNRPGSDESIGGFIRMYRVLYITSHCRASLLIKFGWRFLRPCVRFPAYAFDLYFAVFARKFALRSLLYLVFVLARISESVFYSHAVSSYSQPNIMPFILYKLISASNLSPHFFIRSFFLVRFYFVGVFTALVFRFKACGRSDRGVTFLRLVHTNCAAYKAGRMLRKTLLAPLYFLSHRTICLGFDSVASPVL